MNITLEFLLKSAGLIAVVYLILGLFNVQWQTRVRAIAAIGIGIVLLGMAGWNRIAPANLSSAVSFLDGSISLIDMLIISLLAFASGLLAYLAAWPNGLSVAPLAAPAGLAYWAMQTADMRTVLLYNPTAVQRNQVFSSLATEGIFWLLPIFAGLAGVLAGAFLFNKNKQAIYEILPKDAFSGQKLIKFAIAAVATVLIAQIIITILAQDIKQDDLKLGQVIGQTGPRQIAFAVFIAFLAAGYVAYYFAETPFFIPTLCATLVLFLAMKYAVKPEVLNQMVTNWPAAYFPKSICCILPIQMVAFGSLGAFTGFRIAVCQKETAQKAA